MAQPKDWLGKLIENEVQAVIAWRREALESPGVKPDPDTRFGYDGSNLRSEIPSTDLSSDNAVQLSKVLAVDDPVTILITDGFTTVKARLSDNAITTLESELEEKMDSGMKGDVFAILKATVISTPVGPADDHVQLDIHELEYKYHLRKVTGQPRPIEERAGIERLYQELINLWKLQYGGDKDDEPDPLAIEPQIQGHIAPHHAQDATPKSQKSQLRSSPPNFSQQSPATQYGLATQIPTRRKRKGPSLAEDGIEIETGVNLDDPVHPNFDRYNSQKPSNPGKPVNDSGKHLLGLFRKRKAEEEVEPRPTPPPPRASSPSHIETQILPSQQILSKPINGDNDVAHAEHVQTHGTLSTQQPNPQPLIATSTTAPTVAPTVSRDYSRRKVPKDQQKLLDRPESWLPSLPGQKFPHPNVPISLLKRWNEEVALQARAKAKSFSPPIPDEQSGLQAEGGEEEGQLEAINPVDSRSSSPQMSSDDDEEITPSQWPPSPSQKRPELPPDSTINSTFKFGQAPNRHDTAERTISIHNKPPDLPPDSSSISTPRAPHPLPKRPDWIPKDMRVSSTPLQRLESNANKPGSNQSTPSTANSRLSDRHGIAEKSISSHNKRADLPPDSSSTSTPRAPHPQPLRLDGSPKDTHASSTPLQRSQLTTNKPRNDHSRPSTANSRLSDGPFTTPQGSFMRPSPKSITRSGSSPQKSKLLVQDIPPNKRSQDEMEMEMGVPRSLEEDPANEHRRKRSEYFRSVQRLAWIENNCVPDNNAWLPFSKIYSDYKKACPKDEMRVSDFAQAVKDVYPNYMDGLRLRVGFERQSSNAVENEASSAHLGASTADVNKVVGSLAKAQLDPTAAKAQSYSVAQPTKFSPPARNETGRFVTMQPAATRSDHGKTTVQPVVHATPDANKYSHDIEKKKDGKGITIENTARQVIPASSFSFTAYSQSKSTQQPTLNRVANNSIRTNATQQKTQSTKIQDGEHASVYSGTPPGFALAKQNNGPEQDCRSSTFAEFASAWKTVRPGGKFAQQESNQGGKGRGSVKIDVLSWQI